MFKSVLSLAIALSLVTPAEAARRSNYFSGGFPSESQRQQMSQSSSSDGASPIYREGRTPEQVARARVYTEALEDRCRSKNQGEQFAGTLLQGGMEILAHKIDKRNRLSLNRGSRWNDQRDCTGKAEVDYEDMRDAEAGNQCRHSKTIIRQPGQPAVVREVIECQQATQGSYDSTN